MENPVKHKNRIVQTARLACFSIVAIGCIIFGFLMDNFYGALIGVPGIIASIFSGMFVNDWIISRYSSDSTKL